MPGSSASVAASAGHRAGGRRGCFFSVARHGDLIAVGDVRGEIHGHEIRIMRRPAGFCERITRTRVTGKGIHARMHDRARNVDEGLSAFGDRCVNAFRRRGELRCGMRRELRRPQHERNDDGDYRSAGNRGK